jgi:hypothetical protein
MPYPIAATTPSATIRTKAIARTLGVGLTYLAISGGRKPVRFIGLLAGLPHSLLAAVAGACRRRLLTTRACSRTPASAVFVECVNAERRYGAPAYGADAASPRGLSLLCKLIREVRRLGVIIERMAL